MSIAEFYEELIKEYLKKEVENLHGQVGQLSYYRTLTLREAIEDAVFGRYVVDGHQFFSDHFKNFPQHPGAQEKAREKLLSNAERLFQPRNFLDLYNLVRAITENVAPGKLGLLFYYDTALRIGASMEIDLFPEVVFLQRGAEAGAKAARVDLSEYSYEKPYVRRRLFDGLSEAFKEMRAMDIEAFLCVNHPRIAEFMEKVMAD